MHVPSTSVMGTSGSRWIRCQISTSVSFGRGDRFFILTIGDLQQPIIEQETADVAAAEANLQFAQEEGWSAEDLLRGEIKRRERALRAKEKREAKPSS